MTHGLINPDPHMMNTEMIANQAISNCRSHSLSRHAPFVVGAAFTDVFGHGFMAAAGY